MLQDEVVATDQGSPSSDARRLSVHAAVVGAGWFLVAFPALVAMQASPGLTDWLGGLPAAAQGVAVTVVLAAAVPVLWPAYIAIGWIEAGLASRIRRGDPSARRPAARLLKVQALAFAVATAVALTVLWLYRSENGVEYVALAWVPLAVIAALHLRTARALSG